MKLVSDPAILAQLGGGSGAQPVTDPALLAQLNGTPGSGQIYKQDDGIPVTSNVAPPETSQWEGFLKGATRPYANIDRFIGAGLKQVGIDTGSDQRYADWKRRFEPQPNTIKPVRPGLKGRFAGELVSTLPETMFLGPIGGGAAVGALTSNADDPLGVAVDAGISAAGGKATDMLLRGATRIIAPKVAPAVRSLLNKDIPLTIGQTMGGVVRDIEDKATSVPVIGPMINNAKLRAVHGLNRTAINEALSPIGQALPDNVPIGREAVEYAAQTIGNQYDNALAGMTASADSQFVNDLTGIINKARSTLPTAQFDQFGKIVQAQIGGKAGPGNTFASDALQGANSELGRLASGYRGDASFDVREMGGLLGEVQSAFRGMIARSNPAKAAELRAADAAFARLVRVEKAAGSAAAKDGVFSAPQLAAAVKAADKSSRKSGYARGKALMQDLSDPANAILPSTVPDSGTAGRALAAMALGGGVAAPKALPLLLAAPALYTRRGQDLARFLYTAAPQTRGMFGRGLELARKPTTIGVTAAIPSLTDTK